MSTTEYRLRNDQLTSKQNVKSFTILDNLKNSSFKEYFAMKSLMAKRCIFIDLLKRRHRVTTRMKVSGSAASRSWRKSRISWWMICKKWDRRCKSKWTTSSSKLTAIWTPEWTRWSKSSAKLKPCLSSRKRKSKLRKWRRNLVRMLLSSRSKADSAVVPENPSSPH